MEHRREFSLASSLDGSSNSTTCTNHSQDTRRHAGAKRVKEGMNEPCYLSLVEHHDAVGGQHGVETVGDGQRGAVLKRRPDGLLDQSVRLRVHGGRCFVQDQNLSPTPGH